MHPTRKGDDYLDDHALLGPVHVQSQEKHDIPSRIQTLDPSVQVALRMHQQC
jgi:hypothetical protein